MFFKKTQNISTGGGKQLISLTQITMTTIDQLLIKTTAIFMLFSSPETILNI